MAIQLQLETPDKKLIQSVLASLDVKLHSQSPQALIMSDTQPDSGRIEYEFTATTATTRLRLRRLNSTGPTILIFVDRLLMTTDRDTNYTDTVYLATGDGYLYGFQGQEKDDEIRGLGNSVNYKYRMHDARIGRFFAVDPLGGQYPHNGSYNFSENRVIDALELEGLEKVSIHNFSFAPFKTFGGGFKGDGLSRKFGDEIRFSEGSENYRLGGFVKIDLLKDGYLKKKAHSTTTHHEAFGVKTRSEGNFQEESTYEEGQFFMQLQGNNDGFVYGLNPGFIDNKVSLTINKKDEYDIAGFKSFNIVGETFGDRFPSNETFMTDGFGTKLMMGVSGPDSENALWGPFTELMFTAKEHMQKFEFEIIFNDDDKIMGVTLGDKSYSVEGWNDLFKELKTNDSDIGTEVSPDDGFKTDHK